jgi:hypothetical protein
MFAAAVGYLSLAGRSPKARWGFDVDSEGTGVRRGRVLWAVGMVFTWVTLLAPVRARAQDSFYVRQPEVEKGKTEIEDHSAVLTGTNSTEDFRQSHEIEATYGLTDRWELIVEGLLQQPVHGGLQGTEVEAGTQFEMIKRQGDGIDLAFRTEYVAVLEHDEADKILFGPIIKYVKGRASTTFDAFFNGQMGEQADTGGLGFQYNWQAKYELNSRVGLGVEAFGEIEDLANAGSFNDQPHRIGPVIYLNFGEEAEGFETEKRESEETEHEQRFEAPEFNVAAGVLLGLTDVTSDVTFKLDAELEF